jgi:phage shock protein A
MFSMLSSPAQLLLYGAQEVGVNRVKRWTMSVTSWVDGVLAQVENHEATVDAAIVRVRKSVARARVQVRRVDRDHASLEDALATEIEAESAWRQRARTTEDEETALECLRRAKAAHRHSTRLRNRITEHERSLKELNDGIGELSGRLRELVERRNVMRTRQSRAEAIHGMAVATSPLGDLNDLFERWETRVAEVEIAGECGEIADAFESEFERADETAALREELRQMRS